MGSIAMEEYELMKDSKYRVYVSAVDKALKNFDYTSEWADLISALGKLNKVLMSHQKFPVIPRRIKISKRLAQCMHPALPSGVHLKALETYDVIFRCMGTNRLSHELFIYSAGLFPLLGHSAMNVRPSLLKVYETHFVPLGERLRPGLSGFLSGVLPGLEEGSDHFERTNLLLEKVCEGVSPSHFYGCVWDCMSSNNAIRLPAISFVLSHFNKKLSMEDQLYIMGTNIDMMVVALCAGVRDQSVLVQRSTLDLLLVGFPMHNSQLVREDMVQLVTAALGTILRRDMSLNRRLFAWLLGSEVNMSLLGSEHPLVKASKLHESSSTALGTSHYFQHYSREMLVQAIKTTLDQSIGNTTQDVRPYRLLVSLLDKPDIGPVVLDDVLVEVFRALYLDCEGKADVKPGHKVTRSTYKGCQELLKSANLFFSSLEPCYIWQYAGSLFSEACARTAEAQVPAAQSAPAGPVRSVGSGPLDLDEVCALTEFLLDAVSLETYPDAPGEHLPVLFLHIVTHLTRHLPALTSHHVSVSLRLAAKILARIQPAPSAQIEPPLSAPPPALDQSDARSQADSQSEPLGDRGRANSDLTEYKTTKAGIKTKMKKSKTDLKMKRLSAESTPVLLSVSFKGEEGEAGGAGGETALRTHLSTPHLDRGLSPDAEEESPPIFPEDNPVVVSIAVPTKQQTVLEQCKRRYEAFYVRFLGGEGRIVERDWEESFKALLETRPRETERERTAELEGLLQRCLERRGGEVAEGTRSREGTVGRVKCEAEGWDVVAEEEEREGEWEDPMKIASSLLVELSTFPSFCLAGDDHDDEDDVGEKESWSEKLGCARLLPAWLRVLLVCSCRPQRSSPGGGLQLIAASTLLDLVGLLRDHEEAAKRRGRGGVVPVLTARPLLSAVHMRFVEERTDSVQVLARSLWRRLADSTSSGGGAHQQVTCVSLLHRLHAATAPHAGGGAVEDVVGESLGATDEAERMEAFRRFATLWHVGRDLQGKGGGRSFDRSLLKMLDNLLLGDSCPLKLHAQSWLIHSLLRGDIARVLDPLLCVLLDPCTARMSVLHVSIQHSDAVKQRADDSCYDEAAATAKIYAISSEDGNVIYHVQQQQQQQQHGGRSARSPSPNYSTVRAKQMFAVQTLVDTRHYVTDRAASAPPPRTRNVSLFINPMSTSTAVSGNNTPDCDDYSAPTDLRHARRMYGGGGKAGGGEVTVEGDQQLEAARKLNGTGGGSDQTPAYEMDERGHVRPPQHDEPEMSTPADEFFGSALNVVEAILEEIVGEAVVRAEAKRNEAEQRFRPRIGIGGGGGSGGGFHPLHQHMLLYCGVYDSARTLYALRTVRGCLLTNARMFLCAAATTGLANVRSGDALIALLARHRKSVFGKSFHGDVGGPGEFSSTFRSSMYLEVLISVCLYFSRSFYPNLGQMRLTAEEISGNRQVQLASAELLMLVCAELILIVRDSGKGFACYIADLLARCKVQKVVMHCLVSGVHSMKTLQDHAGDTVSNNHLGQRTLTEEIVNFNDPPPGGGGGSEGGTPPPSRCNYQSSQHAEAFQIQLLRLVLSLVMLEHQVNTQKSAGDASESPKELATAVSSTGPAGSESQLRYTPGVAIPQQPMFLAAVLTALELRHTRHLHQHWTTLVTSALPFMGPSLTHVVVKVITQLCSNVEHLASSYSTSQSASASCRLLTADYTVTQLEALTVLCHYCLLDSAQQQSHSFSQQLLGGYSSIPGANPGGQIFNNLMHVFMPAPLNQESSLSKEKPGGTTDPHAAARRTVLTHLPRIIGSLAVLWHAVTDNTDWEHQSNVLGNPRTVKHQLLEFLSPISLHHGVNFLAAIAVAWMERRPPPHARKVIPVATPDQQVLVNLVGAIRVMPIDTLVQTVHQVVKQPPPIQGAAKELSLEVSVLELFYCYIQSGPQLAESWASLLGLLRDGLTLTPPAQFLMLAILNQFIQKCPPLPDKKDQRDLQDITARLVESCTQIAGACLEQTNWLRRNLAVREDDLSVTGTKMDGLVNSLAQYSVQAQAVLAELLAPLLDVSYGSQEKERVVALLTALMGNIVPYLKNHTMRNASSFHACSQLLASLSSYQYTRKAWRRDVFDLLLDPALFQMEPTCLPYWKTIVDNLMTHDNTTFRDLMARVSMAQSNSLSIFSNREAEYEVRAQLLKRLAFVILCSETDQYHKYMPEIQERLSDSLRLPQVVPSIQAQVLLCFRVLLLRMSPQHVTSLWPTIIAEMVQVLLHIEQELNTDTDQFSGNGLHAHGHPHWLQLQHAAAKLLDVAVLLPAHQLPQFQMYRWAFVGGAECRGVNNNGLDDDSLRSSDFVPHVVRIARLMDAKYACPFVPLSRSPGHLLLDHTPIRSLQELRPFFSALGAHSNPSHDVSVADLEAVVEMDFLERLTCK